MTLAVNKCSMMRLYSDAIGAYSHQVRLVIAEKEIDVEIVTVNHEQLPEDLIDLNPYQTLPTLVDRELTLYQASIIMEYLDERFPHPPLMSAFPAERAQQRLMFYRMQRDWYSAFELALLEGETIQGKRARKNLYEDLIVIAQLFKKYRYFMSDEFSLVDCFIAPLLWRLPQIGIALDSHFSKEFVHYLHRLFSRPSFFNSLTDVERKIRPDYFEGSL